MTNRTSNTTMPPTDDDAAGRLQAQIDAVECCHHTNGLVRGLADGSATGLARWYGRFHVATCKHCTASLETLTDLNKQLDTLREDGKTG